MVVEQEIADLYPLSSEHLLEYLGDIDCRDCGFPSCAAFAEALAGGDARSEQCTELDPRISAVMSALLAFEPPVIPYDVMMESLPPGLRPVGKPLATSPVLVTCNFKETVSLLEKILKTCSMSAFLVLSDTKGYSVDNAVEEKRFTPFEVFKAISHSEVGSLVSHRNLLIPGLARHLTNQIANATGWAVLPGPVSGFEIPLFAIKEVLV